MLQERSCIFGCSRIPRTHVEPQRSCAAVKWLISLFCQTSESIISYTNGLNYDQMSWVTCCHETPCESCFIRSQHVLPSAKPCLLAPSDCISRTGLRNPLLILSTTSPLNCFAQRLPQHIFPPDKKGWTQKIHFQVSFATALAHIPFDSLTLYF